MLSRARWTDALLAAGFTAVTPMIIPGSIEDLLGFDVILARAGAAPATDEDLDATLRAHLRDRLPAYMVPASITVIDRIPLSANGKIDRRALVPASAGPGTAASLATDRLQQAVGEVVAEVMQLDHVDPYRSLFELGASSLTLVSLQRLIGEQLGRTLPLQRIFEGPTVAEFAAAIADGQATTSPLVSFGIRREGDERPKLLMMPGIFASVLPTRNGRRGGTGTGCRIGAVAGPGRRGNPDRQHRGSGRLRDRPPARVRAASALPDRRPLLRRPRRARPRPSPARRRRPSTTAGARRHGANLRRFCRPAKRRTGLHRHDFAGLRRCMAARWRHHAMGPARRKRFATQRRRCSRPDCSAR